MTERIESIANALQVIDRLRAEVEGLRARSYSAFFDAVCRRAEDAMLATGKLEGAHYAAMRLIKTEWDKAASSGGEEV